MVWVSPVDISKYLYHVKGSGIPRIRKDAPDWAKKEFEAMKKAWKTRVKIE